MSLYGYKKKWKRTLALRDIPETKQEKFRLKKPAKRKALWQSAFPKQIKNKVQQEKKTERRLYAQEAREFICEAIKTGQRCPITGEKPTEVHHTHGRRGMLLRWKPGWLAVSRTGHNWLHEHIQQARERGWICQKGLWNKQPS